MGQWAARATGGGPRVLLAWELGEGLGHAARLLLIAERLQAAGCTPIVAARNPMALAERYAAAHIPVLPAPAHHSCFSGPGRFRPATFADMMGVCGFAEARALLASVTAWDTLLEQVAPDIVIADYSPLLSLAAFGQLPLIAIGDGFVNPPSLPDGQFPPMGEVFPPLWCVQTLLRTAQQVQAARGLPVPENLAQITSGAGQVVSVPRELDIYAAMRPSAAAGPWALPAPPLALPSRPHVFAYLRFQHPLAEQVLNTLIVQGISAECYLHGASPEVLAALRRGGIHVHAQPPVLREVLSRASLLVHHGGIGSLEEAAMAGRPQLLLPRQLEQVLNVRRVIACLPGTVAVPVNMRPALVAQRLPSLVNNLAVQEAAQRSALRLCARQTTAWHALTGIFERALGLQLSSV